MILYYIFMRFFVQHIVAQSVENLAHDSSIHLPKVSISFIWSVTTCLDQAWHCRSFAGDQLWSRNPNLLTKLHQPRSGFYSRHASPSSLCYPNYSLQHFLMQSPKWEIFLVKKTPVWNLKNWAWHIHDVFHGIHWHWHAGWPEGKTVFCHGHMAYNYAGWCLENINN